MNPEEKPVEQPAQGIAAHQGQAGEGGREDEVLSECLSREFLCRMSHL